MTDPMSEAHAMIDADQAKTAVTVERDRPGTKLIDGVVHYRDPKGILIPEHLVKAQHQLEDETVRKVFGYAEELSAQIRRFRLHTFDDVDTLLSIIAQEYGDLRGGVKGNVTLTSYDGLQKVQVAVADDIHFGPSLQNCRNLVDACLKDWADGARAELQVIVQQAFDTDKEGNLSRTRLLGLRRLEITDPRWTEAMRALNDSIEVVGSKRYTRFYRRAKVTEKWEAVSIDVASA